MISIIIHLGSKENILTVEFFVLHIFENIARDKSNQINFISGFGMTLLKQA